MTHGWQIFAPEAAPRRLRDVGGRRGETLCGKAHNNWSDRTTGRSTAVLEERLLESFAKTPDLLEQIFDSLPDVLFFVKDLEGRYLWANNALVERSGLRQRSDVIGRTADQLFPASGTSTMAQDLEVVRSERPIRSLLRLYWTYKGERYWCLSSKFPMRDPSQCRVVGVVGLSRDLPRPNERHRSYHRLAKFLNYIDQRLAQSVLIADAADYASISTDTLGRLVHEVFHVTPKQLLMKKRIDKACELLESTDQSITEVAYSCGYADHSAFTRQFKSATHVTPNQYRVTHKAVASAV
jgi:PAS domain S-box-containing protein